jgi:hypothetical protein
LPGNPQNRKAGNLWLEAGKHKLRLQRVGVYSSSGIIGGIELRPSAGRPEASVTAAKTLVDIVRAGEPLEITVTGGGTGKAVTYELLRSDAADISKPAEVVGEVHFPASATPETKAVKVACPVEGAFMLGARVKGGVLLTASEFPIQDYGVVDVNDVRPGSGKLEVIHDVDCVAQTDNGQPIPAGSFRECNGATQIHESKAGKYRESHDCTPPGAESMIIPDDPHSFSGFSYTLDVPQAQVPYLIDVEFPDDDRRSVTIPAIWVDEKTNKLLDDTAYPGKAYETGGMQPLTYKMQHHRAIVWAASKKLILGVLSQEYGHRAAVAKFTISRFADDLVPVKGSPRDAAGRSFSLWYEESMSWQFLVQSLRAHPPGLLRDFVGLDRWIRQCRYYGLNGITACGISYDGAYWRSTKLEGMAMPDYDLARLAALLCEKYGMTYTPEIFDRQTYMDRVTIPAMAEHPDDVHAFSAEGAAEGPSTNLCDLNPLHPAVQKVWIDALGELADKLRDCKSFRGIMVRSDKWLFQGAYHFPSINWGYGDWIIHQFEHDTGLKVPGRDGDPNRFAQRFDFLNSPAVKDRWVKWRCDGILDYHKRLRDRIQGDRHELFFAVAGDFRCDKSYENPYSFDERALDCGIDLERYKKEDGLAIFPRAQYGFRSIRISDQTLYDGFLDPETVDAGMGTVRGFCASMLYQELGRIWPAEKLGVNVPPRKVPLYYCSAAIAAGRNSLEKFAVVLAEQDSSYLWDGGNSDIAGDPEIWNPWFAEYKALPALRFTALDSARDPVAVWFRPVDGADGFEPGFYFYAVNREQYPVRIDIALKAPANLVRLGNGEKLSVQNGILSLELQPYELRAYRAPSGERIVSATTVIPEDKLQAVRNRLAFAQDIAADLAKPPDRSAVDEHERTTFLNQLNAAWNAYSQGYFWRTRTALSMAPAFRVYLDLAKLPEGQIVTAFPGLLQAQPNEGEWLPKRPVITAETFQHWVPVGTPARLKPSTEINPQWGGGQVLMADSGTLSLDLDIPADGTYTLNLGHVATAPGVTVASLDGASLAAPIVTNVPNAPETTGFSGLQLKAGKARLTLRRDGDFGIYAVQLLPRLKEMPNSVWSTLGPFKTVWQGRKSGMDQNLPNLQKDMETNFLPSDHTDINAVYKNSDGQELRWRQKQDMSIGSLDDEVVSMSSRAGVSAFGVVYAVTFIHSDTDRLAELQFGADWWAQVYLNGEEIVPNTDPDYRKMNANADFISWFPDSAVLKLKKGTNVLLVKQHGGSQGSAMAGYITDDPGIVCTPKPAGG